MDGQDQIEQIIPTCRLEAAVPEQERESSLKFQTRCVRCFPDGTGFAVGSVEGRVAMEYFDQSEAGQARKYAFKCHRSSEGGVDTVHPVNSIAFSPVHGTFATGGATHPPLPFMTFGSCFCKDITHQDGCASLDVDLQMTGCINGCTPIFELCSWILELCLKLATLAQNYENAGGDGVVNIWDGANKKRLCQLPGYPTSVSALAFSREGKYLAVASSYTWEQGEKEHPADAVYVRTMNDSEVKPKPRI